MAGSNCQAGRGKMAQPRLWARRDFYRRGRLRKLAHVWESPVGMELVLEHGNFCLRVGLLLGVAPFLKWGLRIKWPPIHKMATLLFYQNLGLRFNEAILRSIVNIFEMLKGKCFHAQLFIITCKAGFWIYVQTFQQVWKKKYQELFEMDVTHLFSWFTPGILQQKYNPVCLDTAASSSMFS
jgi:hypothetical protein